MNGLPDEYRKWLREYEAEQAAANTDRGYVGVFDPDYCKTAYPVRVPVGDFETAYDFLIPDHEYLAAIARVQRGHSAAPYCPFEKTTARLYWYRLGMRLSAHWVCVGCATKAGTLNGPWSCV